MPILQLYIIGVYPVVDFSLSFLSWFMLRNLIKRKVFLIKENSEDIRKKIKVDLFEIRYLPIDFVPGDEDDD